MINAMFDNMYEYNKVYISLKLVIYQLLQKVTYSSIWHVQYLL